MARLVSVIIPVYNSEEYLVECLESVLSQDYQPTEVVAVNNNSTDRSPQILDSFRSKGVVVVQERRPGAAAARNAGIRASRGSLLAFQDADDIWFPGKLKEQVAFLDANPAFGIVFGQFANWYPNALGQFESPRSFLATPERWEVPEPLSGWIYTAELLACPISMITPMILREVFDGTGPFDESLEAGSDYDFWLRATYRYRAHKLPRCFALYRQHGQGITSRARPRSTMAVVLERAIKSSGLSDPHGNAVTSEQIRRRFAELWFHFGMLHMEIGDPVVGAVALRKYFSYEDHRLQGSWDVLTKGVSVLKHRLVTWLRSSRQS